MLGEQPSAARSWLGCLALLLVLGASSASAQTTLVGPGAERLDSYWELGSGINLGLVHAVVSHERVWGELSTVIGVPLASMGDRNGVQFAGVLAVGYGLPFAEQERGRWMFDLFVEAVVGSLNAGGGAGFVGGGGFGFGFRYLLDSSWSFGMRMPCFGLASLPPGASGFTASQSVGLFFIANVYSWSVFTVGYRF